MSETPSFTVPPFIDNPALSGRQDKFTAVTVATMPVLSSWKDSLFSHEWLNPDGSIRSKKELSAKVQEKFDETLTRIKGGNPLERPVLGIGIMDNIEIGSGKDLFLTLAASGIEIVPVHIPKSHLDYFRVFIRAPSDVE
jgi:hypothetical protein